MEGLVVVSYAKQLHLITSKARIEWLLRGEGNELTQSQGQRGMWNDIQPWQVLFPQKLMHACKLPNLTNRPQS